MLHRFPDRRLYSSHCLIIDNLFELLFGKKSAVFKKVDEHDTVNQLLRFFDGGAFCCFIVTNNVLDEFAA